MNLQIYIVGHLNTPLSAIDGARQKVNKDIEELNNIINHQDIIDIYRPLCPKHLGFYRHWIGNYLYFPVPPSKYFLSPNPDRGCKKVLFVFLRVFNDLYRVICQYRGWVPGGGCPRMDTNVPGCCSPWCKVVGTPWVYRLCVVEVCSWNLYNLSKQYHPKKFN